MIPVRQVNSNGPWAESRGQRRGSPLEMPVLLPRTTRGLGPQQGFGIVSRLGELGWSME